MSISMSDAAAQARSELARHAIATRWADTTPEQRKAQLRKPQLAAAVRKVVDNWADLTDNQRRALEVMAKGGGLR